MIFAEEGNNIESGDLDSPEEDFPEEFKALSDQVIFLVQLTHEAMLPEANGVTPIEEALKGFSSFLKSKIISNYRDKVALVFFGSDKTNNKLQFEGIDVKLKLDLSSAERIMETEQILSNIGFFGVSETQPKVYEALWICKHLFEEEGQSLETSQRIFLFTTEDDPNSGNEEFLKKAYQHATQLNKQNIEIELFPLRANNKPFDYSRFYGDIVTLDADDVTGELNRDRLSNLGERLRRKEFKKRMLGRVDFRLSEGLIVGSKFYAIVNKFKKPVGLTLEKGTGAILTNSYKYVCQETNAPLYENQIGSFIAAGKEKVEFTHEEMERIKTFGEPSLVLLGFKPRERIKAYHNVRSSYFVYPDDERVENSSRFFHGLVEVMEKKQMVGIVRFIPKKSSRVRFAAIFPQQE